MNTVNTKMIYMDYAATTPVDPRVVQAFLPFYQENFGNSASRNHSFGWVAEEAVEKARAQVAGLIGAQASEIIFTSGATESNNLALQGVAQMYKEKGNHVITCVTEHKAILDPAHYLETLGLEVTFLGVNRYGAIDLAELKKAITDKTILISLMAVNNETGTIHPLAEIGKIAKEKGVLFHTDGTQAAGKIKIDVQSMGIDILSMSGHKMYGPKGVGALYVRRKNPRVRLSAVQHGGGHERGMRSGTLNVPGIVGLGAACELAAKEFDQDFAHNMKLRKLLIEGIQKEIDMVVINSDPVHCVPGILNISFEYIEGESLMMGISDIALASGSACTSASLEPSYVLKNAGLGDELAHSSIRFSFGRFTSEEDIHEVVRRMARVVKRLRDMSPLYELVKEGVDLSTIQWTAH